VGIMALINMHGCSYFIQPFTFILVLIIIPLEMANKPAPVGIAQTRPRFDGESPH